MGEAQELQLSIMAQEANEASSPGHTNAPDRSLLPQRRSFNWWLKVAIYAFLVIAGQSVATLLGRLYFDKGGDSKWLATVVQLCGFPVLLPYYCIPAASRNPITKNSTIQFKQPSTLILASVYGSIGLLLALDCYLYSVGLAYLPVSTYSLICASQLAFNALFSFLLNSQKFTPYIVNSLVLLTISSTLLVFQGDSADDPSGGSKTKYAIGFICTVGASAGYGLVLSLTQLAFKRVIRKETFRVVMDMIVYQALVATCVILVGLFASGEWKGLKKEMGMYKLGTVSYVMNLVWTAITWQLFGIGAIGLILEASSLFSNAISAMGLPVVPVLAVIFFHDKMDGIKAMAMVLAIWGFISYAYQHYLDDRHTLSQIC
ncbi:PREDICTED: probable purine permease 10 isoform X3 [Prunus mume]|uniref:Probable purine permease n=1 Tax=Prunus mume TaxID=102107 RepID=A0ABM1LMH8_PRUMU|nr:PREDICTED: probable purine permease 10 isoform X3 [Prunus mume]